ncbi:LOW QUALITY PROTEIN: amyloid-beta A4 precursor protein-binding family A member 2 [Alosa alosa]|uniref:LOW QUALITY PROTEIN: amyloid-beta A4 precursor protein-binding family A member 2 n=1 Tax=Alosa alosa TaxID=278164 RepID=UPI00201552A3|nr:LOW QUALITY PROTEIN: amyloid-beta A4 precursor protein-binding family A member 2 [Alosa alosa]
MMPPHHADDAPTVFYPLSDIQRAGGAELQRRASIRNSQRLPYIQPYTASLDHTLLREQGRHQGLRDNHSLPWFVVSEDAVQSVNSPVSPSPLLRPLLFRRPPPRRGPEGPRGPRPEEEVSPPPQHPDYPDPQEPELPDSRPETPVTPDHTHEHSGGGHCHGHHHHHHHHSGGCHGHAHGHVDSLDDSSSDYVNNTSDEDEEEEEEEEDYDEGLPEEDEGVTYYIRYCPEDDSYLEGPADYHGAPEPPPLPPSPPADTDECQEAVEEWVDEVGSVLRCEVLEQDADDQQLYDGRPEPVLDHLRPQQPPATHSTHSTDLVEDTGTAAQGQEGEKVGEEYLPNDEEEVEDEEEDEEEEDEDGRVRGDGRGYAGEYYGGPEDNGNSVCASQYRGSVGANEGAVVVGSGGEETEEDIDQIVAEIKMSMSMGSLSSASGSASATDQSPDELALDPAPASVPNSASYPPEARAKPQGTGPHPSAPHRHDGRPKSLNIPPARHNPDGQRGFKVQPRSPDERQRWAQEQVTNNAEQPRKQQRSDLNVPLENNNVPEPTKKTTAFPSFVDVPGPCEPEDLIDGIIFAANYLGSTQLLSERNPSKNIRMMQAQEAVSRVKRVQKAAKIKKKASPEGDAQTLTEVDLFISTQRIKVLNADTQETMMDNALRTISYIADIGNIVVLMARRRMPRTASQDCIETTPGAPEAKKQYKMICHVFESEDAQLIAQSIGQAFSVAYQEFLRANGINPEDLSQKEYSDIINTQEMYNDDLIHFSNSDNCKELQLEKQKGEILGIVIVESGWGSILPTVILANMMNGGPAARSGKLSIGDQIMSINNTSLVGLPLATCQGIIKGLKNQVQVKMNIVSCPPVTTVLIKRPDLKYQLGFSVQNGIICSLMRGGIAERGGVRVGHRIIEINGQSVVATAHEKIVQALSNSVGEIHMKTMPAAMFRLLTGQETPMYI